MSMKVKSLFFATLAMLFIVGCEETPTPSPTPDGPEEPEVPEVLVTVTPTTLAFGAAGGEKEITLSAEDAWSATPSADWLSLDISSGDAVKSQRLVVRVEENTVVEQRDGTITFTVGDQQEEVAVIQQAAEEKEEEEPEESEVTFYINPEGGYPGYSYDPQSMQEMGYGPGEQLWLVAGLDMAVLALLDYDYQEAGCTSYSYLTTHFYPPIAGDKENVPTESCLLINSELTYFIIGGTNYYPIVPSSPTDEKGRRYGFHLEWTALPNMDINVCSFRIPAQDKDGNRVVIEGGFSGKINYDIKPAPSLFDLDDFGLTEFEYVSTEDNVVTLTSTSFTNGTLTLKLTTTDGSIVSAEGSCYSVEEGTLSGRFVDAETGAPFVFESGSAAITARDVATGAYSLSVKSDILFSAPGLYTYKLAVGEHNITISNLP